MTHDDISDFRDTCTSKSQGDGVSRRLPAVAEAMKQAGVARVRIAYERRHHVGSIEDPRYYTAKWAVARPQLPVDIEGELLRFFTELLKLRYPTWADVEGTGGAIEWDLASDVLIHTHVVPLANHECDLTIMEGL